MKSLITYNSLELIVESKRNRVVKFSGSDVLKQLVKKHFDIPIYVLFPGRTKGEADITIARQLKPGSSGYIQAVLIDVIQNELGMEIQYNVKIKK